MMPSYEIVSQVLTTAGGEQAWVEMDGAGQLAVRCVGCGLNETKAAMAPALLALVEHAGSCHARR